MLSKNGHINVVINGNRTELITHKGSVIIDVSTSDDGTQKVYINDSEKGIPYDSGAWKRPLCDELLRLIDDSVYVI